MQCNVGSISNLRTIQLRVTANKGRMGLGKDIWPLSGEAFPAAVVVDEDTK